MAKYKVLSSKENIYQKGEIIEDDTLINRFVETCNEVEDADFIGYILTTDKKEALELICNLWNINLQKLS